jgi:FAD/FMN-containing dehydrogenase
MRHVTPASSGIVGRVWERGREGYEKTRRGSVWHAGAPDRFPEMIVRVNDTDDVVAAVKLAAQRGLQVAIRSGGHSWAGSHLRDDSLLIDLSSLRRVEIDESTMTATVEPGITGWELGAMLRERDLFFPTGHSEGIALGGYLLQGGFGWNSRTYGPACMSVTGIDVVTADGVLVHADESENADLLWAARGAGTGFFGVVVRFTLRIYPRKKVELSSSYVYPTSAISDVCAFLHDVATETPAEVGAIIRRHDLGDGEPIILLTAIAYTDDEDEARAQLETFARYPGRAQALVAEEFQRHRRRARRRGEALGRRQHGHPRGLRRAAPEPGGDAPDVPAGSVSHPGLQLGRLRRTFPSPVDGVLGRRQALLRRLRGLERQRR